MGWQPSGGGGGGKGTVQKVKSSVITVNTGTGPTVTLHAIVKVPSGALAAGTGITLSTTGGKAKIAASAVDVNPLGNWVHNYWYSWLAVITTASTHLVKGTLYFTPFPVFTPMTVKAIGVYIRTAVATTTVRLGIYNDTGHGKPSSLVLDATTVLGTASGLKTKAIATHVLAPGQYWLCLVRQGTSAVGTLKLRQHPAGNFPVRGYPTGLGGNPQFGWKTTASTHTGALPATAGAVTALLNNSTIPAVQLQSA